MGNFFNDWRLNDLKYHIAMAQLPKAIRELAVSNIQKALDHRENTAKVALLGLRGFMPELGHNKTGNDRGIYDDAVFLTVRDDDGNIAEVYRFKFNTDPSTTRKGMACLPSGDYLYKLGYHGYNRPYSPYRALVQAEQFVVARDFEGTDKGMFGINIHKGGKNSTSSAGCQTVPPEAWPEFIRKVEALMKKYDQDTITYSLMNESDRRKFL